MKGYAFITSSTQDESSQESDRLRLVLYAVPGERAPRRERYFRRQQGDAFGAYQFAFNETLENTQATLGGVQHPSKL